MVTTDITVPVPEDRVPEFYRWFADWIDKSGGEPEQELPAPPLGDGLDAAMQWWKLLKPRERQIFRLWAEKSPRMLTAGEIVEELGLNGPRDIPGILSWPTRKGRKAGFKVHWNFRYDPTTNDPLYGIESREYADLILRASTSAEAE